MAGRVQVEAALLPKRSRGPLGFAYLFLLILAAAPSFAASYSSSQSGNWSSASTWGGAGVPGSGDTATVTNTVTLDITVTVATLNLSGTLTGASPLTVTSSFNWTGGTMSGASTTTISSGATMTMSGGGTLDARTLSIAGGASLNITGGNYFYAQNNAVVSNGGTIDFQGDGGIYFNGASSIVNNGTIRKSGGTGNSYVSVPLTANGGSQLLAQSGTFNVAAVTSSSATFDASSGATLTFNTNDTRTFDAGSTISGAGTIAWSSGTNTVSGTYNVTGATTNSATTTTITSPAGMGSVTQNSGTLTLNGASTITLPSLAMAGGTLNGSAPIALSPASMTWSGGTIAGTGAFTVPPGATITMNGYVYYDTRTITNSGTFDYASNYYSYFYNGASFINNATVDFQGDGGFYIGGGSNSVINNGTIVKSAGTGQGGLQVPLTLNSGSQLLIQSGSLLLGSVTASSATMSVSSGATANFYYSTTSSFDAASTISGAGTVRFDSGTNTINASYNISGATIGNGGATTIGTSISSLGNVTSSGGTLLISNSGSPSIGNVTVAGGTLTLNIPTTLTFPLLTMAAGTLNGTASLSPTSPALTWTGGTIGGSGTLTIPLATTVNVNGYVNFDTRAITNGGSFVYSSSYYSYFYNGASFTNNGSVNFQGDGGFYIGGGSDSVVNNGTITKSGGTGNGGIQVPLTMSSGSQLQIQSGSLLMGNVTSSGATTSVFSGATLDFYYTTTASFDAASTISGAGSVQFGSGTISVSGSYNVTGATNSNGGATTIGSNVTALGNITGSGGALTINNSSAPTIGNIVASGGTLTLNIPGTVTVPALTMSGGTVNGTASITVTAASMTWTGGTIGGSGTLTIPPGTTVTVNGYVYYDTRAITNGGSFVYSSSYYSYFYNGASFTNNGSVNFQGDGGFYIGGGSDSVVNNGTITKSGGTGNGGIQVPLTMNPGSQLQIQSGTLLLGNVTSTGAAISVSSGATLSFYYTTTSTFDAASSIGGAGNVQFAAGTNTINAAYSVSGVTNSMGGATTLSNITSLGNVAVNGGTLTLNGASTLTTPALTMNGGTLNGTLPLAVGATAMTWTGGTISGTAALTVPSGATITMTGYVTIDGRQVTNAGTINFTTPTYMYMQNNAVLTNSSTIDFQTDASIYLNGVAGSTAIVNNGTIKKSGGTSASTLSVPLTANGGSQLLVQSGILYVGSVTSSGSTTSVSTNATLWFYYTTTASYDAASTISGAGNVQFSAGTNTISGNYNVTGGTMAGGGATTITNITSVGNVTVSGGTLTLNGASTVTAPLLTMSGGTLNGTLPLAVSVAAMTWSGGTIAGSSALTVPAGATITMNGYVTIDSRPVTNGGAINLTNATYMYMQNNAVLTNNGTIDFQTDASIYLNGPAGTTAVVNNATIKKSGGTATSTLNVAITANSGSQLLVQSGTLYIGSVTSSGSTTSVSTNATLWFYYTTTASYDAASTISGAGAVDFSAGTNSISGPYNVTGATIATGGTTTLTNITSLGNVTMNGGTLTANGASTITIPTLTMNGGTLNGTLPLAVTAAAMTWSSGTIGGSSTLTIPAGATITMNGYVTFDGRQVSNAGAINLTNSTYFYMQGNAVLTNNGTIDFQTDASIYLNGTAGTTAVVNNATIKKSGGTGNSTLSVALTSNGGSQLLVQSGALYLGDVTSTGGTLNVSTGSSAHMNYTTTATFDAASTISGGGALQVQGGTTTINGTIATAVVVIGGTLAIDSAAAQTLPSLTMNGGTFNGTAAVTVSGPSTWTGGTVSGSGSLTIPSGVTININGYPTIDTRSISNAGTFAIQNGRYIYLQNNAVFTNSGIFDLQGNVAIYTSGGGSSINNSGTLQKSGAGASNASIAVPVTNASGGILESDIGTLTLSSLTNAGSIYFPIAGATTFGTIAITNAFALGGTLSATTISGYTPAISTTFQLLSYPSASGAFTTKNLTYAGGVFTDSYSTTAMTLTATNGSCDPVPSGLVSWWRAEGSALDTNGTNNGTFNGASTTAGYVGQAFNFNGSNSVNAGTSTTLAPNAITVEFWANPRSFANTYNNLVSRWGQSNAAQDSWVFSMYQPDGKWHWDLNTSGGAASVAGSASAVLNQWTHVAATYDGTTAILYVNGTLVGQTPVIGTITADPTSIMSIGCKFADGVCNYGFDGLVDEVAVYNRALSGAEIQSIYAAGGVGKCAPATPSIASFTPASGFVGTAVTITGSSFTGTTSVQFGGVPATSYTVDSPSQITAIVPAGGSGLITVTTSTGTATSATAFTVNPCVAPTITPGGPTSFCNGGSVTLTASTGYTSYLWSNGATTQAITVTTPGSYSVTGTGGTCNATSSPTTVTVNPIPAPTMSAPPSACGSSTGNTATASGSGGSTFNWSITGGTITAGQGTTTVTFDAAASGSVSLTVTETTTAGCSGSITQTIPINSAATSTITAPSSTCAGTTGVNALVSTTPGATYNWTVTNGTLTSGQGSTSITFDPGPSGSVGLTITVTAGSGCPSVGSASIPITPLPPSTIAAPASTCPNTTNLGASVPLTGGATYNWSIGGGTITAGQGTNAIAFTAGASGSVSLSVTVSNGGCVATGTQSITISPAPSVSIAAPPTACPNQANLVASVPTTAGATYNWTIAGGTVTAGQSTSSITYTAGASGTVSLGVNVTSGSCSASGAATTTISSSANAAITAVSSICSGSTSTASVAPLTAATYAWTIAGGTIVNGQGTSQITYAAAASGTVSLGITVTTGSCSSTGTKNVSISQPQAVTISGVSSACSTSGATLTASAGFVSYSWSNGATTQAIQVTSSGTYSVTAVDASGCSATASKSVTMTAPPSAAINAPAQGNSGASLTASVASGPFGTTYSWSVTNGTITAGQGTSSITFTAGASGNVGLSVTVALNGCSATSTASVSLGTSSDLALSMSASAASIAAGDSITYSIVVTNHGPDPAPNVTVTDTPPAGAAIGSVSGAGWNCSSGSTITCTLSLLNTGSAAPISIVVTPAASSASVTNSAGVTSGAADPNLADNTASATTTVSQPLCGSAAPALIAPADGASTSSTVTFSWSPATNATSYEVWAAVDGAPAASIGSTASTSLTANIGGKIAEWFVAAHFGASCPALFSAHRTVSVTPANNCGSNTAAVPSSPVDGATVTSPVTFSWSAAPGASGYRVWIAVDGAPAQDVGTADGITTTLTATVPAGAIDWFVVTTFSGCSSVRSRTASFRVPRPDPCADRKPASLVSPPDGANATSGVTTFQWTSVAGANGYRLWAAVDGATLDALGTTTDTTMTKQVAGGAVEWYVETLFNGCASVDSGHRTFTVPKVQNCPSTPASLVAPAANASLANGSVTFSWSAVTGAIGYELWLSLNNGTPTQIGTTTTATTLTRDVAPGSIEWFVRTDFDGCPSVDSAHSLFTYTPPPSCGDARPLLSLPLNGSRDVYSPVNFSWKETGGATGYKLWVSVDGAPPVVKASVTSTSATNITVPAGDIDWYVESTFNGCPSTRSTVNGFEAVSTPAGCVQPLAPLLITPASVSANVLYSVTWQKVAGAASYALQESASGDFTDATTTFTADDHVDFTRTNTTGAPISYYYRVRGISGCGTQPGAYSSVIGVSILPSVPAGSQLVGAMPVDSAQTLTYSIPLDPSLIGLAFTATPNQPWMTVAPSSGVVTAGLALTVTVNTASLPVGTSLGGVTITTSPVAGAAHARTSGGTTTTTTVSVSLVQPVLPQPKDTPPPDALIIPAVAHADGVNSKFQSDVRVTNTSPQVMKYQVTFVPTGDTGIKDGKQTTIDVDPGRTVALDDILGTWFSSGAGNGLIGTLEIRPLTTIANSSSGSAVTGLANLVTFASSRTFNVTANGTYGQYIPAIPFANFVGAAQDAAKSTILSLQQVAESQAFRTNIGLVEGSGQAASVMLSIYGDNGQKLKDVPMTLQGGQHIQLNSFLAQQGLQINDGRVEVKVTSATGRVTAYASVLDNRTNDPLLVTPVAVNRAAAASTYVLPGVADLSNGLANWRTDMRLLNASTSAVNATLQFYSQSGGAPHTAQITIAPGEVKQLDSLLGTIFGVTNDGGALHIVTDKPSSLVATARTYNDTGAGTYGQFISAVTPNDGATLGSRPLQLLQVEESDRFRTNVGIAEVSGNPVKVQVSLVPPDNSTVTANVVLDLGANEFRQLNSLARQLGMPDVYNARVSVKVIGGTGRVTSYASVIDAQTQDPTYVPAQ